MSQDVIDALGNGVGFPPARTSSTAGPLTIGVGGLVETLLRAISISPRRSTIPVKDWVSCAGGWGGTISYSTSLHSVETVDSAASKQVNSLDETLENEITVHGDPSGAGRRIVEREREREREREFFFFFFFFFFSRGQVAGAGCRAGCREDVVCREGVAVHLAGIVAAPP